MFDKTIGVEQVGDRTIRHTSIDWRPVVSLIVWAVLTLSVLGVATSCTDDNGLYQGPNDSSPRYGGPR